MILDRVISGGQTGADQAAWRTAKAAGIPTGGKMPRGFLTEDGPRPEFAELYNAEEIPTESYRARTVANVEESDGTLWLGSIDSRGFTATHDAAIVRNKPFLICYMGVTTPKQVRDWIVAKGIRVLNVVGNRESVSPGIGERAEASLARVFRELGLDPAPSAPGAA